MSENQECKPKEAVKFLSETPSLRLFGLIELIAGQDKQFSLQDLIDGSSLPKPTVHRMLQQLETANMLVRDTDGRHYSVGIRLRRLAEDLLINDTKHGAWHAVLRSLVDEVGESCHLTALSGNEVLNLHWVETEAPLRFCLRPTTRVPVNCSASGKVLLAQLAPAQRRRLLSHVPFKSYTENTITSLAEFEKEIEQVKAQGYAFNDEEFLPGMLCVAVLVPRRGDSRSNLAVAIQAPIMRMNQDAALKALPALHKAAQALANIDSAIDIVLP